MTIRLGIVMDPIGSIHFEKDSTLAMLLEAQKRGWEIYYFEQDHLYLYDGLPFGEARKLTVDKNPEAWFTLRERNEMPLSSLDVILMRKDPPFNEEYIYTTYILEHAEQLGVLVVNRPQSLRDCNEKLFTMQFPQCAPPTVVSQSMHVIRQFWEEHGDIVCKPLNVMGGTSVFRVKPDDMNANVIFSLLTKGGTHYVMAQRFVPEITEGDKRILLINGEAIPHVLARVPQGDDWRGNLAVGAKGVVQPLSDRDKWIVEQIGPTLRERGLYFVGIDVIGNYLTEINVTSPTGIRELELVTELNISGILLDMIEKRLQKK